MSLRDHLAERARAGDAEALETLLASVPAELPSCSWRRARDARIRALAEMLSAWLTGASRYQIARRLAGAGRAIDAGRSARRSLPELSTDELAKIEADIAELLTWVPVRRGGRRWPGLTQLTEIIG